MECVAIRLLKRHLQIIPEMAQAERERALLTHFLKGHN
jgi:hypothetical protein